MSIQQPRFVDGRSLAVDLTGAGSSIAGGISKMLDRKRQDEAQQQKQAQFDRANDIYSQTSSFLQIDPANRSMALIESAQQDRVNGNEEDYQEKIRISQMSPDLIEQELMQDFSNASNILGRDPMGGLKQMGLTGATERAGLASAKTEIYPNGTAVQALPGGDVQVRDPSGRIVTGQERLDVLKAAQDSKAGQAGERVTAEQQALLDAQKEREETLKSEQQDIEQKRLDIEDKKKKTKFSETERNDANQGLVEQASMGLDLVGRIESHPGFSAAVGGKGVSSLFGALDEPIAGTEAAGVVSLIDTLEAQNFLAGIKAFKEGGGSGALSDNEGKKIGAAISNLKRSQSEADFKKNLNVIKALLTKQQKKAKSKLPKDYVPVGASGGQKTVDWNDL